MGTGITYLFDWLRLLNKDIFLLCAHAFAFANETANKVFAPRFDLFSVLSSSIKILSTPSWSSLSKPFRALHIFS